MSVLQNSWGDYVHLNKNEQGGGGGGGGGGRITRILKCL